jgi:hypothetical protein
VKSKNSYSIPEELQGSVTRTASSGQFGLNGSAIFRAVSGRPAENEMFQEPGPVFRCFHKWFGSRRCFPYCLVLSLNFLLILS